MFRSLEDFLFGLSLPLRAVFWIASDVRLLVLSLLPVIVTLALYGFLWSAVMGFLQQSVAQLFMSWGWDPRSWGADAVLWLTRIFLLFAGAWSFSFFAAFISLPILDFLAERAESVVKPRLTPVPSLSWRTRARWILRDLWKSLVLVVIAALSLVLSWIPLLNLIAFSLTCLLVTLQYLSYPQSRRGIGFSESVQFVFRELPACLGMGISLSILFAIPVISALALPLAAVGGTALFARGQLGKTYLSRTASS